MQYFDFIPEGFHGGSVTAYLQMSDKSNGILKRKHPAIIICPGGAYEIVTDREGEPVAKEYFAAGYQVFVLKYAVGKEAKNMKPLCQLAATIAHIRKYSEEWCIENNHIAVCGFSAGGHLAASLGTLFNKEKFLEIWAREDDIRPNALILGYPVITSDEYTHVTSLENVSGAEKNTEDYKWFSLEQHVDLFTPPSFIWHTAADEGVPVENSLRFASALSAVKVPFELHIFPNGGHGMSVCTYEVDTPCPYNARWVNWSIQWLNQLFEFDN